MRLPWVLAHFGQSHPLDSLPPRGEGDHAAFFFPSNRNNMRLLQCVEQLLASLFGCCLQVFMGDDRFILPEGRLYLGFGCV